ncbi:MAG: hypothetical protein ABDH23_06990 [Endomicrobiia bacterium]
MGITYQQLDELIKYIERKKTP